MAITINKAPVPQEELGIILLVNAFCGTRERNLNRFINKTLLNLCNKGIVKMQAGGAVLTEAAASVTNCISAGAVKHDFTALAQKMRELFPAGNKPETLKPWRSSTANTAQRLEYLAAQGYEFTDDEAISATKAYIDASKGSPYMRVLPYFIFKYKADDSGRRVLESDLMTWIEQVRDGVDQPQTTEISDFL